MTRKPIKKLREDLQRAVKLLVKDHVIRDRCHCPNCKITRAYNALAKREKERK